MSQFDILYDVLSGDYERRRRAAMPWWRRTLLRVKDWLFYAAAATFLLGPWVYVAYSLYQRYG